MTSEGDGNGSSENPLASSENVMESSEVLIHELVIVGRNRLVLDHPACGGNGSHGPVGRLHEQSQLLGCQDRAQRALNGHTRVGLEMDPHGNDRGDNPASKSLLALLVVLWEGLAPLPEWHDGISISVKE